jgi:hypothetical protein
MVGQEGARSQDPKNGRVSAAASEDERPKSFSFLLPRSVGRAYQRVTATGTRAASAAGLCRTWQDTKYAGESACCSDAGWCMFGPLRGAPPVIRGPSSTCQSVRTANAAMLLHLDGESLARLSGERETVGRAACFSASHITSKCLRRYRSSQIDGKIRHGVWLIFQHHRSLVPQRLNAGMGLDRVDKRQSLFLHIPIS